MTPADTLAPVIGRASLTRRTFRVGAGTGLRFSLSEAARVRIARRAATARPPRRPALPGPHPPPAAPPSLRALEASRDAHAQPARGPDAGAVPQPRAASGRYRFSITATDAAGNTTARPVRLAFRVLPRIKVDEPDQDWEVSEMARLTPDPTFYASPSDAASAPAETLAYVVTLNTGTNGDRAPDALTVLDLEDGSPTYGQIVGRLDMPNVGDELHHFGWNACSSALCPWAPHPHVERRYLLVPGLRSSRIHVVDVKADPHNPKIVKVIEPEEIAEQDRLPPAAHDPLRPRRDLRLARSATPRATGPAASSCSTTRPSSVKGAWEHGPRAAGARLRLLVAPRPRHGHHQRVGHAEHGRERPAARAAARATSTATSSTSGTSRSARTCRRSTSAPSTRWCSSCGRRTTRARPTGSSAWSPRPPT